jgi:hypothetical protein
MENTSNNDKTQKYYKVNKKLTYKKIIIILVIIISVICMCLFLAHLAIEKLNKLYEEEQIEITSTDQFLGRDALLNDENADYHSYLLIFSEKVTEDMKVEKYYYHESPSLNILYTIFLEYTLESELFDKEKTRLSELKMSYNGEEKDILSIDTGSSDKNCYLSIYDEYGNYEYAFTDDATHRIVCVFTQYDGFDRVPEELQLTSFNLAKDQWESDKIAYNMYWFWQGKGSRYMPDELIEE